MKPESLASKARDPYEPQSTLLKGGYIGDYTWGTTIVDIKGDTGSSDHGSYHTVMSNGGNLAPLRLDAASPSAPRYVELSIRNCGTKINNRTLPKYFKSIDSSAFQHYL